MHFKLSLSWLGRLQQWPIFLHLPLTFSSVWCMWALLVRDLPTPLAWLYFSTFIQKVGDLTDTDSQSACIWSLHTNDFPSASPYLTQSTRYPLASPLNTRLSLTRHMPFWRPRSRRWVPLSVAWRDAEQLSLSWTCEKHFFFFLWRLPLFYLHKSSTFTLANSGGV